MASVISSKQKISSPSIGRGGQVIKVAAVKKHIAGIPTALEDAPAIKVRSRMQFDPAVAISLFVVSMTVLLSFSFMKLTIGTLDSLSDSPSMMTASADEKELYAMFHKLDLVNDSLSLDSRISMITGNKERKIKEPSQPLPPLPQQVEVSHKELVERVYTIIASTNKRQTKAMQLARSIVSESARQKYDPLFVAAVMKSESAFNEMAVSHVGAQGLMQIMPATGKYLIKKHQEHFPTAVKLTDREVNIKLGIKYLRELEGMYQGNRLLTLIAYNWGPGKLDRAIRSGRGVPKECIKYALKILRDHNIWQA